MDRGEFQDCYGCLFKQKENLSSILNIYIILSCCFLALPSSSIGKSAAPFDAGIVLQVHTRAWIVQYVHTYLRTRTTAGTRDKLFMTVVYHKLACDLFNSAFPCGLNPDINIYSFKLKDMLDVGECVLADGTYRDPTVLTPDCFRNPLECKQQMDEARAQHEHVNGCLKTWKGLGNRWQHDLHNHHIIFRVC